MRRYRPSTLQSESLTRTESATGNRNTVLANDRYHWACSRTCWTRLTRGERHRSSRQFSGRAFEVRSQAAWQSRRSLEATAS
jgi:hypothetical protein